MVKILIVDDRPLNREFLTSLLQYNKEYQLLEASDGAEALEVARFKHPDLIITDILMPTMDGYEFVRQLRADSSIQQPRVIFYTAHYLREESRALAKACQVSHILLKPSEPQVILDTVAQALSDVPVTVVEEPLAQETFDREHLQLLTNKLANKNDELGNTNHKLKALLDISLQVASEHDPEQVLEKFTQAARDIVGAKYALVGVLSKNKSELQNLFVSGMNAEVAATIKSQAPTKGILGTLLNVRRTLRMLDLEQHVLDWGLEMPDMKISSFIGTTIASPGRIYGWLCLWDKIGMSGFSDEDEQLAALLAAQLGRTYENNNLYLEQQRHSKILEHEIAERQQVEATLRDSQTQMAGIIGSAMDAIISIDEDQKIILFNQAAEKKFGYPSEAAIGKPIDMLIPMQFRQSHRQHIENFGKTNVTKRTMGSLGEIYGRRLNGEEFPIEASISQLEVKGKKIYTVILRDISERKQTEEALLRTEERFRRYFELGLIGMAIGSKDKEILEANDQLCKILGYERRELLQMTWSEITHPDDLAANIAKFNRVLAGEVDDFSMDKRFIRKDGEIIYATIAIKCVRRADGSVDYFVALVQDITERKRAEEEKARLLTQLQDQNQRIDAIVSSIPGIVWEIWGKPDDPAMRMEFVSDYVEKMLGYTVEESLSTPSFWLSIMHPDDKEQAARDGVSIYESGTRGVHLSRGMTKDGHSLWIETHATVLCDDTGKPTGMRGVSVDVTERKNLEKQLIQAQKMEAVGRLAGGVAHDFNNLLTAILGYSQLILRKLEVEHPMRGEIEEINKAGFRAAGLTRQLLAFSRSQVLQPTVLDINAIVRETEKMLKRLIGEDIELISVLDEGLANVKADPGQITQVIMNLAINARDAMPDGGRVLIETKNVHLDESFVGLHIDFTPGPYVLLMVSDSGIGMDAEICSHIFEPFFTTKGPEQGTGLGLSTVYGIIKQSGGHISVYSEPGQGTVFKIYLPQFRDSIESFSRPTIPPQQLEGTETILVVEDDPTLRPLIAQILESNGYKVLNAASGKEAMAMSAEYKETIHLLLTDMIMPEMNGQVLAEQLTATRPELQVLFMSGYTDNPILMEALKNEVGHFIQKPFAPDALVYKIRTVFNSFANP